MQAKEVICLAVGVLGILKICGAGYILRGERMYNVVARANAQGSVLVGTVMVILAVVGVLSS